MPDRPKLFAAEVRHRAVERRININPRLINILILLLIVEKQNDLLMLCGRFNRTQHDRRKLMNAMNDDTIQWNAAAVERLVGCLLHRVQERLVHFRLVDIARKGEALPAFCRRQPKKLDDDLLRRRKRLLAKLCGVDAKLHHRADAFEHLAAICEERRPHLLLFLRPCSGKCALGDPTVDRGVLLDSTSRALPVGEKRLKEIPHRGHSPLDKVFPIQIFQPIHQRLRRTKVGTRLDLVPIRLFLQSVRIAVRIYDNRHLIPPATSSK